MPLSRQSRSGADDTARPARALPALCAVVVVSRPTDQYSPDPTRQEWRIVWGETTILKVVGRLDLARRLDQADLVDPVKDPAAKVVIS